MYNQYNDFVVYDDKFNVVLQNIGFLQASVNENSKVFSEPLELGSLVSDHQIFELVGIECDCLASGETMLDDMNELDGFYKEGKKFIIQTKNKTYNNMIIQNRGEVQDATSGLRFQLSFIEFLEEATEVKTVTATPKEPKDTKTVERGTVQGKQKRTSILGKDIMIELDLIKAPNQSFKFKDFDITIRLTKNDTYIQILKNGVLILPFIRIVPFKNLLQFGEYDFDFIFEATNKNEKIDYKKFGITQRFYYYDK